MCGIAGIFAYRSTATSINRRELRDIRDHMVARGPDGEGEWFGPHERIALAHRRLAIIDLSDRGAQPMVSADGRLVITFNGEIYNYRELKRSLVEQGRVFQSDSDTEVLLHLYAVKGEAMLGDLRGMFAFAIWDARDQSLFLARDAFGIKPLYYADDGKTIRFASQVKALLQGNVDTTPEPAGHVGFFLWGSVPSPWTLYNGIRGLQAGHCMRIAAEGQARSRQWTSVREIIKTAADNPARGDRTTAARAVGDAIQRSVAAHMVADVPVGVFLSSGLDSCMIAANARRTHPDTHAVTLGFNEYHSTADDEVPLAREVAEYMHLTQDVRMVSRQDFADQRNAIFDAMDQPSIDGVNTWFVAMAASQTGLKVALSGLGGDELFGSYPSFTDVPRMHRLAKPFARVPQVGRMLRSISAPVMTRFASPKFASLLEYGASFGGAYLLRRGLMLPWELSQVLDADFAAEGVAKLSLERELNASIDGLNADRFRVSSLEMSWYMRHQLLRDSDWASMAHSLELRVPLVDTTLLREVIPWYAAFPDLGKAEVAAAAAPEVPAKIWNRPKTGFSVPIREWLLADLPNDKARGLRGWARRVYQVQTSSDVVTMSMAVFGGLPNLPSGQTKPRILVSTIGPGSGGVHTMTGFVVDLLREQGFEPVIAHYEPYSLSPALSVPSFKLLGNYVGSELRRSHDGLETHAIGAWLPEHEFPNYFATRYWRNLMSSCQAFVSVSGNNLAATPFWQTKRPYVAWVATDWCGDRIDRVRHFSLPRRILDSAVNAPIIRKLERRLLSAGTTLALSAHTYSKLRVIRPALDTSVLPMPVSTEWYTPRPELTVAGRIGFTGRFDDPRKNIGLLLEAFALVRQRHAMATLTLIGGIATDEIAATSRRLGIGDSVRLIGRLEGEALRAEIQSFDVFVVPSHQEGLCIAALEAMACGVPVVSTRCGGPEEFVLQGVTGGLVDFVPTELADAVGAIIANRAYRTRLSRGARDLVETRYTHQHAKKVFLEAFFREFPALKNEHKKGH